MTTRTADQATVDIAELGEALSGLRLCDPSAVEAMGASLRRHGQLTPVLAFEQGGGLEVIDGFKRLRAARLLGLPTLRVQHRDSDRIEAKLHLAALHTGRGLTELEEGWLVRSLHREDGLSQGAIAERLGRHKSWVCRRLMLVEGLESELQACVRLGLLAPRAAVVLAALPRGNQAAAMQVVMGHAMTVRQTELLVSQLTEDKDDRARSTRLTKWASGQMGPPRPGPKSTRVIRSEADWMAADIVSVHRLAARLQARLLAAPLNTFGPTAAELLANSLVNLVPVLDSLRRTIAATATVDGTLPPPTRSSAA